MQNGKLLMSDNNSSTVPSRCYATRFGFTALCPLVPAELGWFHAILDMKEISVNKLILIFIKN